MSEPTQVTQTPTSDPVKDSLFKSLKLTVLQTPEPSAPDKEPKLTPSGEIVPEGTPEPKFSFDTSDGSLNGVLTAIREEAKKEPPKTEDSKPDPEKVVEKKEEPKAATPVEVKPKKVAIQAPEPTPSVLPPVAPVAIPEIISDEFDEEEKEEIELAKFAAKSNPEKYSGFDKKLESFFKKHNEYLDQKLGEDPHFEPDADKNEDYRRWLQANRPDIPRHEKRRLERELLIKRAKEEAVAEADARLQEVNNRLREVEIRPRIAKSIDNFVEAVNSILPEDIAASVKSGTLDEDLPLEGETVKQYLGLAKHAASEFLNLTGGLTKFDSKNPTHSWLGSFIHEQGTLFLKNGGKELERDGKKFLPRAEYNGLPADRKDKFWSFTDSDVLDMLAYNAKTTVESAVAREREKYEKVVAAKAKKTGNPPKPVSVSTPTGGENSDISPRAASAPVAPAGISNAQSTRDPLMAHILGPKT
jgi:hypothetical protein